MANPATPGARLPTKPQSSPNSGNASRTPSRTLAGSSTKAHVTVANDRTAPIGHPSIPASTTATTEVTQAASAVVRAASATEHLARAAALGSHGAQHRRAGACEVDGGATRVRLPQVVPQLGQVAGWRIVDDGEPVQ